MYLAISTNLDVRLIVRKDLKSPQLPFLSFRFFVIVVNVIFETSAYFNELICVKKQPSGSRD